MQDFDYIKNSEVYLDSACQSLRPRPVIDKMQEYYTNFNACGERATYDWAKKVDEEVANTRTKVLKFLQLSPKHYFTSFTLNTTYGINLILSQINSAHFDQIITSEIEHNSIFLPTIAFSRQHNKPRHVLSRDTLGNIDTGIDFTNSIVVVNAVSNFDGRKLHNLKDLTKKVHKSGGIIIIDAAQTMSHSSELLKKTEVDAICFSAHKMYGPSLGVIVARKDLIKHLNPTFLGGGMVDDVTENDFILSGENHISARFEPGLQAWAEIIGLGETIDWLSENQQKHQKTLDKNAEMVYNTTMGLRGSQLVGVPQQNHSSVFSFYIDNVDSHLLAKALAAEGIMARSGYFCAHYYLAHVLNLPPLIRFSLGLHNTEADIEKLKSALIHLR